MDLVESKRAVSGTVEGPLRPDIQVELNKVTKKTNLSLSNSIPHFEEIPFDEYRGRNYSLTINQLRSLNEAASRILAIVDGRALSQEIVEK